MFNVPEPSRLLHDDPRVGPYGSDSSYGNNGAFILPSSAPGWELLIIASDGEGWEHVSVHAFPVGNPNPYKSRLPTWTEMMLVKRTFWGPEDVVMQLAPRESEYVNCHPHTLHWWRPADREIPTPPMHHIGPQTTTRIGQ